MSDGSDAALSGIWRSICNISPSTADEQVVRFLDLERTRQEAMSLTHSINVSQGHPPAADRWKAWRVRSYRREDISALAALR